jgi:cytochrome c-type biogenesis protein CcmH/NrfG
VKNSAAGESDFGAPKLQSIASFPMPGKPATQPELVEVLLIKLKHRLKIEPDDVDGWVLLSKSYYHLNRLNEANQAFEKAETLGHTGDWQPLPK